MLLISQSYRCFISTVRWCWERPPSLALRASSLDLVTHRCPHVSTFSLLFSMNCRGCQGLEPRAGAWVCSSGLHLRITTPPPNASFISHNASWELFDGDLSARLGQSFFLLRLPSHPFPRTPMRKTKGDSQRICTGTQFSTRS